MNWPSLLPATKLVITPPILPKIHDAAKSTNLRLPAQHRVEIQSRGITPEKESEVLRVREQRQSIRDIARQVGCSYDTATIPLLSKAIDSGITAQGC